MLDKIKNKKMIYGWIKKAEDDFSVAKNLFEETNYYDHVCFFSQQTVEKYLKTIVIILKGNLTKDEKTHNLIYLAQLCKEELNFKKLESGLRKLSNAYIPARYPGDGYIKFSKKEAKECLKIAEEIIDFIKSEINLSIYE